MKPERITPIYQPKNGTIPLYGGDLEVKTGGATRPTTGQIELRLDQSLALIARLTGPVAVSLFMEGGDFSDQIQVPQNAPLSPPPDEFALEGSHSEFHLGELQAGRLGSASYFLFHVLGEIEIDETPTELEGGNLQPQINFNLPGWELTLVPAESPPLAGEFNALIKATPTVTPVEVGSLERLHRQLFLLLGFLVNRELGIGPVCGVDTEGAVVWTDWAPPRVRSGRAITWCPRTLAAQALPDLAERLASLANDRTQEEIVDRAIGFSLAANGDEVLDVRIPMACSGLELLASAVLLREDFVADRGTLRRLDAGACLRLLLRWADIPTEIPAELDALDALRKRHSRSDWGGPEVIFILRNSLVHPPANLQDPEWPNPKEMMEAWLLSTWYLELVILRVLGYQGSYSSRIRTSRTPHDLESVPWVSE